MFPDISFKDQINAFVQWLVAEHGDAFHAVSQSVLSLFLLPIEHALRGVHPAIVLGLVSALAWWSTRSAWRTAGLAFALFSIGCLGLWDALMQTLAIMLVATTLCLALGLPTGIAMSRHPRLRMLLLPVLDVMQTLPTFVYLIPVLMLFGLGKVPAIFATVVYALPPLIRMTDLGIRQVDAALLEASIAFGATPWQLLRTVQLPLARPSILAGINQTTMMSLSMVVIASMIGARGLGEDVLTGIQTLDSGRGLQAGLAIVILAIVVDRISQGFGQARRTRKPPRAARAPQTGTEEA
jgi:glycine betaine/proline transport system permease protein